jgi:hypothetical protein
MSHMFIVYTSPMNILSSWPRPTSQSRVPYVPRLTNEYIGFFIYCMFWLPLRMWSLQNKTRKHAYIVDQ